MNRSFRLIAGLLLLALARFCRADSPSAIRGFDREAMLHDLERNVIVPGYTNLAARCAELTNVLAQLAKAPNATTLETAQRAWLCVADAADQIQCFQTGPMTEREFASTFYFWQIVPLRLEDVLNNSSQAINQALLDQAGATTKGLYAVEYLLFDRRGGQATEPASGAKALDLLTAWPRRRQYLLALGQDLEAKANQLAADWTASGPQSAAGRYVAAGQNSVNILVNQLAQKAEQLAEHNLKLPQVLPPPVSRQLYRIQGSRSASSLQRVVATLEGLDRAYRGGSGLGLRDAVKHVNPPLAQRLQEGFDASLAAARAISVPLEQMAMSGNRTPLQSAMEKTHALEILCKVDLASSLGVTLTFTSGDGD